MNSGVQNKSNRPAPLDLERWRHVPLILAVIGGIGVLLGAFTQPRQFAFSYLLAFMFFLSLGLGSLFLVLMHHLFDAGWSVPLRRFLEDLALLLPVMALLFIPIAILAPQLYPWMAPGLQARPDHALHAKQALLNKETWYIFSGALFVIWGLLTWRLRHWSIEQDKTGAARCTYKMRFHAAWGIVAFAVTLTLASILWMKSLQYQWFSTMYGVYYFASSVWLALATAYIITVILDRMNLIHDVLHEHQYYFIGSLMFAFTVFYAYIHFSQYFIIWNGNMPEETWWYVVRERGTWWDIGMIIVFGHFFVPFLALLRIDVKNAFTFMIPLCLWAWIMHFFDLSFNIMPVLSPDNFTLHWLDIACFIFIGGVLAKVFLVFFNSHAPFPVKDPRLHEAMGYYHPVPTQISGGELDEADENLDGGMLNR
jgi:hypothetical protein